MVAVASCGDGGPTSPSGPRPLGPGTYFLFQRSVVPDPQQLIIMRSDGTGQRVLAPGSQDFIWLAALAPDHSRVAFAQLRGVFVLSLADEHIDTVLDEQPPGLLLKVGGLAWSPDSRRLAVSATRQFVYGLPHGLLILNADGQLIDSAQSSPGDFPYNPFAWSPDGQRVAYSRAGIWTSRLDGSDARQVTTGGTDRWPRYSPDGTKIVFLREVAWCRPVDAVERTCDDGLMVVDTSGAELQTLLRDSYGFGAFNSPVWSPDGSQIAYYRSSSPEGIVILNMDGSVADRIPLRFGAGFVDWR